MENKIIKAIKKGVLFSDIINKTKVPARTFYSRLKNNPEYIKAKEYRENQYLTIVQNIFES